MSKENERAERAKVAKDGISELFSLFQGVADGSIGEEEAMRRALVVTQNITISTLDGIRDLSDEIGLAYAVGDYKALEHLVPLWYQGCQAFYKTMVMQIAQHDEFGINGPKGLDGFF